MNPTKSILLVEDDRIDVMTIHRAFLDLSILNPLAVVSDGEEALHYLQQHDTLPGLILLDLNMPRMNGLELLEHLKQDEVFKSIPVVLLTTSDQEDDREKAFALSAAGYIVKPMDYGAFVDIMQTIHDHWIVDK